MVSMVMDESCMFEWFGIQQGNLFCFKPIRRSQEAHWSRQRRRSSVTQDTHEAWAIVCCDPHHLWHLAFFVPNGLLQLTIVQFFILTSSNSNYGFCLGVGRSDRYEKTTLYWAETCARTAKKPLDYTNQ